MLFLRLFLRVGPWFKVAGLAYSECPDVPAAVRQIEAAGLAVTLENATREDRRAAVKCLTALEVQSLLATLKMLPPKKGGKALNRGDLTSLLLNGLGSPTKVR